MEITDLPIYQFHKAKFFQHVDVCSTCKAALIASNTKGLCQEGDLMLDQATNLVQFCEALGMKWTPRGPRA